MPENLWAPQPTAREGKRARARARAPLPRGTGRAAAEPGAGRDTEQRPKGDIAIHQLFRKDVYDTKVLGWFAAADAAVAALRRRAEGEAADVPPVPTVVIEQEEMA
eukprot:6192552-Pleurochrysis_carterae.AAC.1